ncbi:heme A synthase [Paenibacillus albiflavus]|uniref:Heme A synthase n=1 Tax=Paenibacillus albiflavus TaxID=2545760 RepID=A0A4R4E7W6_9BACL|nr:COX15/CtaA family protein [Paenibacillus albiflavus]TCZ75846.1 heme A synthase [Paenibacillus albiflavus]
MQRRIRFVSFAAAFFMMLVVLGGALVTKTDSGKACGDTWPLCNGEFIAAFTIPQIIESSHRYITGIFGILLLLLVFLVFKYVKRKDAWWFAIITGIFTIIQAYLGALAALSAQSSIVMALHFGISLVAFAATFLLALVFTKWGDYLGEAGAKLSVMSRGFKALIWISVIYCYIVVYVGAYVRHTKSSAGCLDWPLCNGELIPDLEGATGIVFMHRVAAFLLFVLLLVMFIIARKHYRGLDKVYKGIQLAFVIVVLQILSGAAVTFTLLSETWYSHLLATLVHGLLIAGLFTVLAYLAVLTIFARKHK